MLHSVYGFTGYMFYDDELNVNPSIVELMDGIADLQRRKGVEFRLRGFVKAELFTERSGGSDVPSRLPVVAVPSSKPPLHKFSTTSTSGQLWKTTRGSWESPGDTV